MTKRGLWILLGSSAIAAALMATACGSSDSPAPTGTAGTSTAGSAGGKSGSAGSVTTTGGNAGTAGSTAGTAGSSAGTAGSAAGTAGTSGGGSGSAGTAGTAGGNTAVALIGTDCVEDSDCGTGGKCFQEDGKDFLDGGPVKGYCTVDCTADAAACGAKASCLQFTDTQSFCLETCTFGDPPYPTSGSLMINPNKCHGRYTEVGCRQLSDDMGMPTVAVCFPACGNDDQCPLGRKCDTGAGVCVDSLPATLGKLGDGCDLNSMDPTCVGICVRLHDSMDMTIPQEIRDEGVCMDQCIASSPGFCAGDPQGQDGFCLYDLSGATLDYGPFDTLYCAEGASPDDDEDCLWKHGMFPHTYRLNDGSDLTLCQFQKECETDNDCFCPTDANGDCKAGSNGCDPAAPEGEQGCIFDETCMAGTCVDKAGRNRACRSNPAFTGGKKYCVDHVPNVTATGGTGGAAGAGGASGTGGAGAAGAGAGGAP